MRGRAAEARRATRLVHDFCAVGSAAPRGTSDTRLWRWPAQLVTSNNMAAIILSLNPRQAERIALALGAGLPAR